MQTGNENKLYDSTIGCIKWVWEREGGRGFYKGLGPNVVRGFGSALLLVGYDEFKVLTRKKE